MISLTVHAWGWLLFFFGVSVGMIAAYLIDRWWDAIR